MSFFKPLLFSLLFCLPLILSSQTTTITLKPGPIDGKDADIRDDYPNSPLGNSPNFIANAWSVGGNSFLQRSLIQFDLSQLPSDSFLISATLSLFCNLESGHGQLQSGFNECYLRRITQNWQEDIVTWNNQPNTSTDNQVIIPTSNSNTQNYPSIDVTGLIRPILSGQYLNYGFMLQLAAEIQYNCMVFGSSDHPNEARRPKLTLVFSGCKTPVCNFTYLSDKLAVSFSNSTSELANYYWDFGDNYYSSVKNPLHIYQEPGTYHVCLISENDCGSDTLCKDIVVKDNIDITHVAPEFIIYPNPTNGIFFMRFLSDFQDFNLTIFNPIGQEIFYEEFTIDNFSSPHEFNITYLNCGLYLIRIKFEHFQFIWKEVLMQ